MEIRDEIKLIKSVLFIIVAATLASCSNNEPTHETDINIADTTHEKRALFTPLTPEFEAHGQLILPEGFSYEVLYSEGDTVVAPSGKRVPAKGMHDCIVYLPIDGSSSHGYLYVSHEDASFNLDLGHGGGACIMEVEKTEEGWSVISDIQSIDFFDIGGTIRNCGGKNTPYGNIIIAEEGFANSNADMFKMFPDTSDFNGKKRYENFGYMVEIDPRTKKALRKLKSMGRFSHEDAYCMPDGKTVYLTQDETPACFYKFVADQANDYSSGTLYAYQQSSDGNSGTWLSLPDDHIEDGQTMKYAVEAGATLFCRHEWITKVGDKLYISETGYDEMDWNEAIAAGGIPANHFTSTLSTEKEGVFSDHYGRVLELDLNTLAMKPFINGGTFPEDKTGNFASPDGLAYAEINKEGYLIINEDIIGEEYNRVAGMAQTDSFTINEVYFLKATTQNPTLQDMKRFLIGPKGCETTGSYFTPDGKNYFVSIQHPDEGNPAPFNKSCVIVITGF